MAIENIKAGEKSMIGYIDPVRYCPRDQCARED